MFWLKVTALGVVGELLPAGQAVHDGFAEWAVWCGGIFSDERFPVVESLFDFGKDVDGVVLAQSPAPPTGVVIIQFFVVALFFGAFFSGGSFPDQDEHFMAARIGVACVVKSASRLRPAEQAHHAIAGNDAVILGEGVGH